MAEGTSIVETLKGKVRSAFSSIGKAATQSEQIMGRPDIMVEVNKEEVTKQKSQTPQKEPVTSS
jgi:hypothetical protein